jgi:hypothetical protein
MFGFNLVPNEARENENRVRGDLPLQDRERIQIRIVYALRTLALNRLPKSELK